MLLKLNLSKLILIVIYGYMFKMIYSHVSLDISLKHTFAYMFVKILKEKC